MSKSNGKVSLFKEYEEYTTTRGKTFKIYPVPLQIINNMSTPYDHEKPKRPVVEMKTKGGTQKRWIKKGDEGWDEYQEEVEEWTQKCDNFRNCVAYVTALQDFEYPNELKFKPVTQLLITQGFVKIPNNEWEHKWMWMQDRYVGSHDEMEIDWILKKFSGIPEEIVDAQRERFRNILLGQNSRPVGDGAEGSTGESEELSEEQPVLETIEDS